MEKIDKIIEFTKHLNILYVEDDEEARELTKLLFENFFNKVVTASNGREGLEKFKKEKFDLVITDINMPEMDGIEMVKKIREKSDVPVIIITAHNEDKYFIEAIKAGVNDFLIKPVDLEQFVNVLQRITDIIKNKKALKNKEELLKAYEQAINKSALVSKTDPKGIITFVNDAFCDISGYKKEELLGKPHNIVRHPDMPKSAFKEMWDTIKNKKKLWHGIVKNRAKDGSAYYVDSIVMPIFDDFGNIKEYISIRKNITDLLNPSKKIVSLLNSIQKPVLLYMKLEDYEILEELYDSVTLNEIEEKAYNILYEKFKEMDFREIFKLNHGEYALIFDCYCDKNTFIDKVKNKQREIKDAKIHLNDLEYNISLIISVVFEKEYMFESAKLGIKELIKNKKEFIVADNLAKIKSENAKKNMQIIHLIKSALEENRIINYFQPIIDNKTKKIYKYESLVRIKTNDGQIISPYFFLDIAKKSKYYNQITKQVICNAFSVMHNITEGVSINLSAIDIEEDEIRNFIFEELTRHRKCADRITFELLEDENIKNFNTIKEFILEVKKFGVSIAIDDFGSGYSNYERLLDYQPDILKIDGSLIKNIDKNKFSKTIVKSIVTFAKDMNIKTVAEFVENEQIFNIINEKGINYSQGYFFGKPEYINGTNDFDC